MLRFLETRDTPIIIVTPGHLYRHVYMSQNNTTEEDGEEIALKKQKSYIEEELLPCLENFPDMNIRLVNWYDYYQKDAFQDILQEFHAAFNKNGPFAKDMSQSVKNFLKLSDTDCLTEKGQKDFACSVNFVLEEYTFFSYAVLNGHPALVYPGRVFFDVHKIALLEDCPPLFLKTVFLSAEFRRKGRRRRI